MPAASPWGSAPTATDAKLLAFGVDPLGAATQLGALAPAPLGPAAEGAVVTASDTVLEASRGTSVAPTPLLPSHV